MEQKQRVNTSIKALVVDDSTTVRRLMELTLSPIGIKLDFTDNGEDAMTLVKQGHYDIVFLDILLPGIDGYRVCKAIKSDKLTKDIPVVVLTSKDSTIDKVRGMMAGSNVYLTKPLDRNELIHAIDKCLPRRMSLVTRGEKINAA
jgi:two-component system, cell cycle response regulator